MTRHGVRHAPAVIQHAFVVLLVERGEAQQRRVVVRATPRAPASTTACSVEAADACNRDDRSRRDQSRAVRIASSRTGRSNWTVGSRMANCVVWTPTAMPPAPGVAVVTRQRAPGGVRRAGALRSRRVGAPESQGRRAERAEFLNQHHALALGPYPSANADASPRIPMSSARHGRRRCQKRPSATSKCVRGLVQRRSAALHPVGHPLPQNGERHRRFPSSARQRLESLRSASGPSLLAKRGDRPNV